MFLDFPLGCSWVFLLLSSSAVCRPTSESDKKYPYAWGYRPRLPLDGSSGLQSAQQREPDNIQSTYSPPGASSQDQAPSGSVNPPEIFPRSGGHVKSPVASGSRFPVSLESPQSAPRMARAQSQSAPSGSPNMGPAPWYFFPRSYPSVFRAGAPPRSFSQDEQRPPVVPGPVPPPLYIIQSRNGFVRFSRQNSRSKYSPEYLEDLADGGDPFAFLGASDPRGGLKV